ncbi:hypothetical protein V5O48_007465 [Marasmius crinis-equi]|uniref:NAD(P)-binding protein n=1 Tax=Marasmius crinis-equi TaxID=585013 RepID=A0ABR3FGJ7_9AGAR
MSDNYKRVILVTGSNAGIGYEIVKGLAKKGQTVYLAARNEASGKEAQEKLKREYNLDVEFVLLNMEDKQSIEAARDVIEKAEGRLDVLVNNAGISGMAQPQTADETMDVNVLRAVFETNFFALVQTTITFLPLLRKAKPGYGNIIQNPMEWGSPSWQLTEKANTMFATYCCSKSAVHIYSVALARELKSARIRVNCCYPGFTMTKLNNDSPDEKAHEQGAKVLVEWSLLGPDDDDKTGLLVDENQLSTLEPSALNLRTFSGTLEQLQALSHTHPYLESVTFRESMQTREVTSLVVAGLLERLTSLTKLKISFTLHSMYDSGNLLKSLIASCPNLQYLELICDHRPSFQIETFSKTIRGFSKLRVLHLSIVRYPGDENLASGAARIAVANPRLEKFTLTFLPMERPASFPFYVSFKRFSLGTKTSGSFTLMCNDHGLPITLTAYEKSRFVWPMGLGYSCRKKRYIIDLRPAGSPSRGKKGFASLLSESSAAGQELRVMVFCGFLVCLAMLGLLVKSLP